MICMSLLLHGTCLFHRCQPCYPPASNSQSLTQSLTHDQKVISVHSIRMSACFGVRRRYKLLHGYLSGAFNIAHASNCVTLKADSFHRLAPKPLAHESE